MVKKGLEFVYVVIEWPLTGNMPSMNICFDFLALHFLLGASFAPKMQTNSYLTLYQFSFIQCWSFRILSQMKYRTRANKGALLFKKCCFRPQIVTFLRGAVSNREQPLCIGASTVIE